MAIACSIQEEEFIEVSSLCLTQASGIPCF